MSKYIKVKMTIAQLEAIKEAADDMGAMIGGGDSEPDKRWKSIVKRLDNFLKKNGYKRAFK